MSIWSRIAAAVSALAQGEPLSAVFEKLRQSPERSVAFAIAVIALGAKMAKADGQVTRNEVSAFREVFHIPPQDEEKAAKVFNLARQDVAGFDGYARQVARMFGSEKGALCDLLEGLFHIAVADGSYAESEDAFLSEVARIFEIQQSEFNRMRSMFVADAEPDPYSVLGGNPGMSLDALRALWRNLVRESHPDIMQARGVPVEAVKLAEKRMVAINDAWNMIQRDRAA